MKLVLAALVIPLQCALLRVDRLFRDRRLMTQSVVRAVSCHPAQINLSHALVHGTSLVIGTVEDLGNIAI